MEVISNANGVVLSFGSKEEMDQVAQSLLNHTATEPPFLYAQFPNDATRDGIEKVISRLKGSTPQIDLVRYTPFRCVREGCLNPVGAEGDECTKHEDARA